MKKTVGMIAAVCLIAFIVAGCSGPEQKKMKFYNKGKELYDKGDYVKARLEFKNATQIDPKFAKAYSALGATDLKAGNLREAYGSLSKAVDLDPNDLTAQADLAKILLQGKMFDKAVEKADLVLKAEPKNEEAAVVKATVFIVQKRYEDARSLLEGKINEGVKGPTCS